MKRVRDVERFYAILQELEARAGPFPLLRECHGRMAWPSRGVYFFFEDGEGRSSSGTGPRVVRVGTHALTEGSRTTLWRRLSQHRGTANGTGGNHRGSVFRLLVGEALLRKREAAVSTWGKGGSAGDAARTCGVAHEVLRERERQTEAEVSRRIGAMRVAWICVDDLPATTSLRGVIERNAIGLLSNWDGTPMDPGSNHWLGSHCGHERVRRSRLWNNNHVEESHEPGFLDAMARAAESTGRPMAAAEGP